VGLLGVLPGAFSRFDIQRGLQLLLANWANWENWAGTTACPDGEAGAKCGIESPEKHLRGATGKQFGRTYDQPMIEINR
jgi:hypothetical protein